MNYIFALIVGVMLLMGLLSTRLVKITKTPNVTGYLITGIVIALLCVGIDHWTNNLLNLTKELDDINAILSGIALGFIALSIGEEFKLYKIKKYGWKIISITLIQAFFTSILVDLVVILTCYLIGIPWYVGLILGAISAATAPAATLMVINQYRAKGPLVDILLPVVAFDDAVGLIIFAVSVSVSKVFATGSELSVISLLVLPLINIIGSIAIGFVLGLFLKFLIRAFKSRNNHVLNLITFTLLGVGICDVINHTCFINGEALDMSNLLCCMMIGATYRNTREGEDYTIVKRDFKLVDRWTPFLFLLFFVLSGCHLVISGKELISAGWEVIAPALIVFAVYLVVRSLGKYGGAYIGCKATHREKSITNYLGITLLPQAGVAIGMANTISQMDAFKFAPDGTPVTTGALIVTVVLCATLVYELVGPLLTKWALKKSGEIPDENGNYPCNIGRETNEVTLLNTTKVDPYNLDNIPSTDKKIKAPIIEEK